MNTEFNITSQPWKYDRRPDLECGDLSGYLQLPTYALDVVAPSGAAPIFNEALEKIVTAVNCHNELLEALQELLAEADYAADLMPDDEPGSPSGKARKAIAKALNQQQ